MHYYFKMIFIYPNILDLIEVTGSKTVLWIYMRLVEENSYRFPL